MLLALDQLNRTEKIDDDEDGERAAGANDGRDLRGEKTRDHACDSGSCEREHDAKDLVLKWRWVREGDRQHDHYDHEDHTEGKGDQALG